MNISLDILQPGQQARVEQLSCAPALQLRLADFGLVPGTCVRCRCQSPDRGLSALEVRGAVLAVRRQDLRQIAVRLL